MNRPLPIPLFDAREAWVLSGDALGTSLLGDIELSETQLWISMFLLSFGSGRPDRAVGTVFDALVRAARRSVDVRVLIDDFRTGAEQVRANAAAAGWLSDRGVPVRVHVGEKGHEVSHSKYLLKDDHAVTVGSANLTSGGLGANLELTVRVESPDLARDLARRFKKAWRAATPWR